jgi:CubicO group peptidase (beta-lactamase class C family)
MKTAIYILTFTLMFIFNNASVRKNYVNEYSKLNENFSQEKHSFNSKLVNAVEINAIKDFAFPGASVLVNKDGKTIYERGFGYFTYENNSPAVDSTTIYDLASLTKVIATTTAVMICLDRNLLNLDDEVAKYIPEFAQNGKEKITIRNLLLHNSGLPAYKKFYTEYNKADQVLKDIYSTILEYPVGTKTVYSDLGFVVLGKIVEKVSHEKLDKFCEKEIFKPLQMNNTFFNPPDSVKYRIAPTEFDHYWRYRLLKGEVHDETASLLNGVAGNAGLFSDLPDIRNFLLMITQEGKFKGKQIIKPETIALFTKRQSDESTRALGWDTKSKKNSSAGDYFSDNSFGHLGFTGCSIWVDPTKNLFVVFLSNRVYPSRTNTKIFEVRPALHNAIVNAFENN